MLTLLILRNPQKWHCFFQPLIKIFHFSIVLKNSKTTKKFKLGIFQKSGWFWNLSHLSAQNWREDKGKVWQDTLYIFQWLLQQKIVGWFKRYKPFKQLILPLKNNKICFFRAKLIQMCKNFSKIFIFRYCYLTSKFLEESLSKMTHFQQPDEVEKLIWSFF